MNILDSFRLDGKVALVTGASRGLGQAMAIGLAEAGADIAGLDLTGCDETCGLVETLGRHYHSLLCDLRQASLLQLENIIAEVVGQFGRLDILVNNAGIIRRAPVLEFSEPDWDDVLHINLKALFFLSQAAGRAMVARGAKTGNEGGHSVGKIVNIASMLSFQGGIRVVSYAAAKSGVAGITRALANELAPQRINVNAIAPGYMATDNTAPLRADPLRNQAILDRIPAAEWGQPADLKGAVVFLASPASDYIHGTILPVDGGWLAR
ncbi:MAG: 2-dehydro-3-deoxy-D-gluconate 5-dehydrogenase KduD [Chloroflexota bacterium]